MSSFHYTPRNSAGWDAQKPKPPQSSAEILEEPHLLSRKEKMTVISLRYQELVAEGKTNAHACRLIAEEMKTGISKIEKAVGWLKRTGRLEANRRIKDRAIGHENTQKIIEMRNSLAQEGKTEDACATIIANDLGLKKSSVWYKIQQLIREGKLKPKREISREARRSVQPSPARGTMGEAPPAKAPKEKRRVRIPRSTKKPDEDPATTEFLMKVRRRVERFVQIDSGALREEHLGPLSAFLQSEIEGKKRFSVRIKDGAKEYYFYLARTLRVEVQVKGNRPLFRESDIPGILFYAILEKGNQKEAFGAIADFGEEVREKKESFPRAVPFALELKIWAARTFCMENGLGGKHSERARRIRSAIDFSKLGYFLDYTQKTCPHMHPTDMMV